MSTGRFILFEGLDRTGKTTQAQLLANSLPHAQYMKLPERTTPIGQLIDKYLRGEYNCSAEVAQLLFCANRYEIVPIIKRTLAEGTTIVMDRYIYSAVAYGSANGLDGKWIADMEYGLPQPDIVIFLDVPLSELERRQGAQRERYENSEMQTRVLEQFQSIHIPNLRVVDGMGKVDEVYQRVLDAI